jgi:hypothetical protein
MNRALIIDKLVTEFDALPNFLTTLAEAEEDCGEKLAVNFGGFRRPPLTPATLTGDVPLVVGFVASK